MRYLNRVILRTPESVELEFTLAGIGNRTLALLLDYCLWGLVLLVLGFGSLFLWIQLEVFLPDDVSALIREWLGAIALLAFFAAYVGYFVAFETLWQGQTPGKRYSKIRVVQETGRPAGLVQALMRSMFRPIDDLLWLGALLIIFGKREKRLGDWLAGTLVVQDAERKSDAMATVSQEAKRQVKPLSELANLERLIPDDFAVIRSYLVRRSRLSPQARRELSAQLSGDLARVVGLTEMPLEMPPELFLETLYVAYQRGGRR